MEPLMDLEKAFKILLTSSKSYVKTAGLTDRRVTVIKTAIKTLEKRYKEIR
jgi:hypothetical protein